MSYNSNPDRNIVSQVWIGMLSQNVLVGICVTVCFGGPYKTHNGQQHNGPNPNGTAPHIGAVLCFIWTGGFGVSYMFICLGKYN